MTNPAEPSPKHCANERICYLYRDSNIGKKNSAKCKLIPCGNDTRQHPYPPKTPSGEQDKVWADFEQWLISTPFPQDSNKICAKILKKTCAIREDIIKQDTPTQQRIADAIEKLETLEFNSFDRKEIEAYQKAIALLREVK